jgi:hypothetical protein
MAGTSPTSYERRLGCGFTQKAEVHKPRYVRRLKRPRSWPSIWASKLRGRCEGGAVEPKRPHHCSLLQPAQKALAARRAVACLKRSATALSA